MVDASDAEDRKVILIIEDNFSTRTIYHSTLAREGYSVYSAASGSSALELLAAIPTPDLMILDRFMPGMDGEEFLDKLRHSRPDLYGKIPILGMSSLPADTPMISRFAGMVSAYMERPCTLAALFSAVKKLVLPRLEATPSASLPAQNDPLVAD